MPVNNPSQRLSEFPVQGGQECRIRLLSGKNIEVLRTAFQYKTRIRWATLVWVVLVSLLPSGCGDRKPTVYRVRAQELGWTVSESC